MQRSIIIVCEACKVFEPIFEPGVSRKVRHAPDLRVTARTRGQKVKVQTAGEGYKAPVC